MTLVDGVLLGVLSVAAIRGAQRGAVTEVMVLVALAAAMLAASVVGPALSQALALRIGEGGAPALLALSGFGAVFVVVFGVLRAVGTLMARFWMRGVTGLLNRTAGAMVGMVKWGFVLALGLVYLDALAPPLVRVRHWHDAALVRPLQDSAKWIVEVPSQPPVPDDG